MAGVRSDSIAWPLVDRFSGLGWPGQTEREGCRTKLHDVSVRQAMWCGQALVLEPRAVLTPKVFDGDRLGNDDASMPPGDCRRFKLEQFGGVATDDVLPLAEWHSYRSADQPRCRVCQARRGGSHTADENLAAKAIADAVDRAKPGLSASRVVDRLSDFVNEELKAGFRHERVGPHASVDLLLRYGVGSIFEQ